MLQCWAILGFSVNSNSTQKISIFLVSKATELTIDMVKTVTN